jgi:hypothetical protein
VGRASAAEAAQFKSAKKPRLNNKLVPVEWLRTQFNYDPETGKITNAEGRKGAVAGADPTYPIPRGYLALKVRYRGKRYTFLAHRLGWALHTGEHPQREIDHEDLDRTNNRFKNFRPATRSQNNAARAVKPRELPKGVSRLKRGGAKPFRAQCSRRGETIHLGCFATPEEAAAAYAAAAKRAFGVFARVA